MTTISPINQILAVLSAAYPAHELTKPTINLYNEMLEDLDIDLLRAAARDHIAQSNWFPKVSELRDAVAELSLAVDGVPTAYEAWELANANGGLNAHPMVAQAMRAIGVDWYQLRRSENPVSDRSRFIEAYNQLHAARKRDVVRPPAVKGYIGAMRAALPDPDAIPFDLLGPGDPPEPADVADDEYLDSESDAAGMPFWNREPVMEIVSRAAQRMQDDRPNAWRRPTPVPTPEEYEARRKAMQDYAERLKQRGGQEAAQ